MKSSINEVEAKEDKTVKELVYEFKLSSQPFLLELNRGIFYSDEIQDKRIERRKQC